MKRLSPQLKSIIQNLTEREKELVITKFLKTVPEADKEKILLDLVRKIPEIYDFVEYEYTGAYDIYFAQVKHLKSILDTPAQKAQNPQLHMAQCLARCTKEINAFAKQVKSKRLEIRMRLDLIQHLLKHHQTQLEGGKMIFGSKLGAFTQKTITLILQNRPPHLWPEYAEEVDDLVAEMKKSASHIKNIEKLPDRLIADSDDEESDHDHQGMD